MEKNLELIRRTYNRVAKNYNYSVEDNASYPEQLEALVSRLEPKSSVLDIGCGTGEAIGYLIKKEFIGTGVDFSSSMLSYAKKRFPNSKFIELDFTRDNISGTYDAFIAYLSLVYTPHNQLPKLLKKFSFNLKGKKLFQIAMLCGDDSQIDKNFWGTKEPMYFISYTKEELVTIIGQLGFELFEVASRVNLYGKLEEPTIYLTGRVP